jgi:hypothetical protein
VHCLARLALTLFITLQVIASDCLKVCSTLFRSRAALAAENLFLRKQLALYKEHEKKATSLAPHLHQVGPGHSRLSC